MKDSPLVYIVILNYNNTQLTLDCLSSLHGLSYSNYRVIVVDDRSEGDSIEGIVNYFPKVTLIRNRENINYCKSFNVGVRAALAKGAEYVFLVNNDTKNFSQDYLEEILSSFSKNTNLGMVGSKCIDYDGGERRGEKSSLRFGIEMTVPTEGYVIKREVFEKVGLFNEWLVIYFEDLDYIARLTEKGYQTTINPSICFSHLGGSTTSKVVFTSNYYRVRNMIMFTKKYCKHRPLVVNLSEIKGNLGVHFKKIISSFGSGDLLKAAKICLALVFGIIVGAVTPVSKGWKGGYL